MSTTMEASVSPIWLDKKMLESWLRTHYSDVVVTDVEDDGSTAVGDNYLSNIQRLVVRTKGGDAHHLIVKGCIEEGPTAEIVRDSNIFNRELDIYSAILPKMYTLLQEALPGDFEFLAPRCFQVRRTFLVLENLNPAGFKMANRRVGLNFKQCLSVMRNMARFYSASVLLHQRDPETMDKFCQSFVIEPKAEKNWENLCIGLARTLVEEMDTWSEEWKKYTDLLRCQIPGMMERIQRAYRRNDSGFNVLNHGDCWTNNMLFNGHGSKVRFLDFQQTYFGSPAIDLHYFLTSSTNMEVRINHMDRLLQEYHTTLCNTLTALGYTKKLLTFEELLEEFDSRAYWGFTTLFAFYPIMQSPPECGFNFDDALGTGKNPGTVMYGEDYKKAVKWHLPRFERSEVFEEK